MSDRDTLARRLADVEIPGADAAAARARSLVLDTFETREVAPSRRRRLPLRLTLGLAGAALLVGVAAASPGTSTIIRSVREAVAPEVKAARTVPVAPLRLPGGGYLLVHAPLGARRGLWAVRADGTRRYLGAYRDGSWSPHARFVVATAGRRLVALDPRTGAVHWSLTAASAVSGARWSLEPTVPPCCRVAYLSAGATRSSGTLHVVAGDGSGDRAVARADPRVAPAWRPRSATRELAYVDAAGAVRVISAGDGRPLAPAYHRGFRPTLLAWSADGTQLLAMNPVTLVVLSARLQPVGAIRNPGASSAFTTAVFAARGHSIVVLRHLNGSGRTQVELLAPSRPARPLETLVGALHGLAAAPDGRRVLVGWGAADQWLLVPTTATGRTTRVTGLTKAFGSAAVPVAGAWHSTR